MENQTKEAAEDLARTHALRDLGDAIQTQNQLLQKALRILKIFGVGALIWSLIALYYLTKLDAMNVATRLMN